MSFTEEVRVAWGPLAQDPDRLREELSGRMYWLWDPPEGRSVEKPYAHLLLSRDNRSSCVKIANPLQLEAWFYPIDKALIPQQSGGQCEGLIWFMDANAAERLCWVEMKMNLRTHSTKQFEEVLYEALGQVSNTIHVFQTRWTQYHMQFLPAKDQRVVIAVPREPKRLRQTPSNFQRKAKRALGNVKVFVISTEIALPEIQPRPATS